MNHLVWHNGKTSWKENSATHCDMMYGFVEVPRIQKLLHTATCSCICIMLIYSRLNMYAYRTHDYDVYTFTVTVYQHASCYLHLHTHSHSHVIVNCMTLLDVRIMSVNSAAW